MNTWPSLLRSGRSVDLTYDVGSRSGREVDKFGLYGITAQPGPVLGVPLIESGCAAWLECRLIREPHAEDAYDTCFVEVVAAAADERILAQGHRSFRDDNADLQTIHHRRRQLRARRACRSSARAFIVATAAAGCRRGTGHCAQPTTKVDSDSTRRQ